MLYLIPGTVEKYTIEKETANKYECLDISSHIVYGPSLK